MKNTLRNYFNIKIKITQRVNLLMQLYCWSRKAETPFAPVQLSHIFESALP